MKKIFLVMLVLPLLLCLAAPALAQSDYDYDWDTTTTTSDAAGAAVGIGLIIVWIVVIAVALAFFIFWIIMLLDCIKRDFPQRSTWLIILIVSIFVGGLYWIAALVYFFVVKRKNLGTKKGSAPPSVPPQPAK